MPGDPFLLNSFLANFDAHWCNEVERLYVCLNIDHRMPAEIREYDIKKLSSHPKVKFMVVDEMLWQGAALRELLKIVDEELIMSIEDDTVIVKAGQIDKCFRKIEQGDADVVGSPRFSCSQEILDASAKKYGLDYSGYGDKGPNLWPNFFFIRKEHLLKTDQHFEPKGWEPGEHIEELDITATQPIASDVFVWLSIQLRAMGLRFYEVPQYHSHPNDLDDIIHGRNLGDGNCPWIHIGSLTMTAEDLLIGAHSVEGHKNTPHTDMEKKELERRFAWLQTFLAHPVNSVPELTKIKEVYQQRINAFIRGFDLSPKHIDQLIKFYKGFIRW